MNRIKELRLAAGLTQVQLADRINADHSTVQRLESGKRQLTEKWARLIAKALHTTEGELFSAAPSATIGYNGQVVPPIIEEAGGDLVRALEQREWRNLYRSVAEAIAAGMGDKADYGQVALFAADEMADLIETHPDGISRNGHRKVIGMIERRYKRLSMRADDSFNTAISAKN